MKAKKFPKFTKMLVLWEDTVADPGWHDKQGLDKASTMSVQSLGFFLSNKKHALKLAHSITDDTESDYLIIPWGCIRSIKLVEIKDTGVKDGSRV